jgi:hypothetical protein
LYYADKKVFAGLFKLKLLIYKNKKIMEKRTKFILDEEEIPKYWYNIQADLPELLHPILHPGTRNPVTADDMSHLFHMYNS